MRTHLFFVATNLTLSSLETQLNAFIYYAEETFTTLQRRFQKSGKAVCPMNFLNNNAYVAGHFVP